MIPDTYNLKKESQVKICKSCNFLSGAFKKALVDGDYEEAVALYGSGNVNLWWGDNKGRDPLLQRVLIGSSLDRSCNFDPLLVVDTSV